MRKQLPYREGSAFYVPLEGGTRATGVVARVASKGLLLGYFFAGADEPRLGDLSPDDAILVGRFGDLYLLNGRWKVIGNLPNWLREGWPTPLFLKRDPLHRLPDQVVVYDDDDLSKPGRWERPDTIPPNLPEDGLMGAGFVEKKLAKLLA